MLTLKDLDAIKIQLNDKNNRRIKLEAEISLIKKNMQEKYGVESVEEAEKLIAELDQESVKIERELGTKLHSLTDAMEKDGLL